MVKTKKSRNIGIEIKQPKQTCEDNKCPFHGKVSIRKRTFIGTVVSKDVHKSATVEWTRLSYIPKYERSEKRKTRIRVHNPPCIDADVGDKVLISECRKLSKTKNFAIIEKKGGDIVFKQKQEELKEEEEKTQEHKKVSDKPKQEEQKEK